MKINENGIIREMTQEEIERYKELDEINIDTEIDLLKQELTKYDYIGVKIAMGVATREEYSQEIEYTEEIRRRIRELEKKIEGE
ncbi:MAG: hypothetical protein HFJ40_05780 [Clostridia bacterium]|nr:hypothetical protein [Clostridia bacterium]